MFTEDNPIQMFLTRLNVNYPKSSFIYQDVQFAWGIKGIDDTDTV